MARELLPLDVSKMPELLKLAEEVGASKEGRVLRRDNRDIAVIMPVGRKGTPPSKAKPVTKDDPIFGLVGIGKSGIPGGVSGRKHEYLAEANRRQH